MLSSLAAVALVTDRPRRPGYSGFTGQPMFAGLAIDTVLEFGQASVDTLGDLGAKFGYFGA
jgi:hypothetical protein